MRTDETSFKQTEKKIPPEKDAAEKWQQVGFAEICVHSAFGPRFSGERYASDGNIATLRTTDISEDGRIEYSTMPLARLDLSRFQQHFLRKDDLVITRTGRVGTTAVFDGFRIPVLPGAFLIRFRLNRELADPRFYKYYLNSPEGQVLITSVATGSVQQNLNITSLHGLLVPMPPLMEQRAIAHILGILDEKIELNQKMNRTLEETGKAIFRRWFSDLEFPNDASMPYRSSGGATIYSEELEREIPKGWTAGRIGEIIHLTMGLSPRGESYNSVGQGLPLINGAADFSNGRIVPQKFTTSPTRVCKKGDLLFCIRGTIGNLTYADKPYCLGRGVASIETPEAAYEEYVWFILQDRLATMISEAAGSVIVGLSKPDILNLKILLPPPQVIEGFHAICKHLFMKKELNGSNSEDLSKVRDSLLPKLMSGKVRVPLEIR